jgi:hypothetical protein
LRFNLTKTARHDIAEILLKVALKHQKSNQINSVFQRILCDNLDTKAQTSLTLVSSLVQQRTTDHGQATGKLYQLRLRVECTFFCNLKAGREPTPYW